MKLVRARVHGYRRFRDLQSVNLEPKVVALVGPNEAGKTSFLRALTRLDSPEEFQAKGESAELTRGASPTANQTVVWARFEIEPPDKAATQHHAGSGPARWLHVSLMADGARVLSVDPPPGRNEGARGRLLRDLRQAAKMGHIEGHVEGESESGFGSLFRSLVSLLGSHQRLFEADIALLREGLSDVEGQVSVDSPELPRYAKSLPDQLRSLIESEEEPHPEDLLATALWELTPALVYFEEDARTLASNYDLRQLTDEDVPASLANLCSLANLELSTLRDAALQEDYGAVAGIQEAANRKLATVFSESWHHEGVRVHLDVHEETLRILVSTREGYTSIAERSDGLRWFIALLAYTSTRDWSTPPVLLVDEAESHLHYDAQADLVRVFESQAAASKIIYTTHSAGCLPEDLGGGVRVVAPIVDDEDYSEIRNWFWEDSAGFSPLFMAMGASALAFTSLRAAVIAEGASDLILLPSLIREAAGVDRLGYQVAPGLAHVRREAVAALDLEAGRVAFIVDSDRGGRELRRVLRGGGIHDDQIVEIRDGKQTGLVLEDLVDSRTYWRAVMSELTAHNVMKTPLPERLPSSGRPAMVARWCKTQRVPAPSRRAVAQRLVQDSSRPIVARNRRTALRMIHEDLLRALGLSVS